MFHDRITAQGVSVPDRQFYGIYLSRMIINPTLKKRISYRDYPDSEVRNTFFGSKVKVIVAGTRLCKNIPVTSGCCRCSCMNAEL